MQGIRRPASSGVVTVGRASQAEGRGFETRRPLSRSPRKSGCSASRSRSLQERMGRSDFKTTLIYADYQPGEREAELIETAFGSEALPGSGTPASSYP